LPVFLSLVLIVTASFTYLIIRQSKTASAAPSFVKVVGTVSSAASGLTSDITVPAAGVAQGNLLVIGMTHAAGITSVSDSRGNDYTMALSQTNTHLEVTNEIAYAVITTALQSDDTITITWDDSGFAIKLAQVNEYTGIASSGFLDDTSTGQDDSFPKSGTLSSGNVTTTAENDLLVAFHMGEADVAFTETTNFDQRGTTLSDVTTLYSEDRIVSSTGDYASSPTVTPDSYWDSFLIAFKASTPVSNQPHVKIRGGGTEPSVKIRGGGTSAISYRSQSDETSFSATSIDIDKPASTASGDLLIFFITTDTDHTITYPDGFTQIEHSTLTSSGFSVAWKLAGGSEPSSYTFGFSGATEIGVASLLSYSGVDQNSPIDLDAIESGAPGAGSPHTTAPVTPSQDNSMIVGAIFIDPIGTPSFTEVPGFPLRVSLVGTNEAGLGVAEKLQTTATNEGVQITEDIGGTWGEYTVVLKPGTGGGGGGGVKFR
jgi:hypothetical protein